MKKDSLPIPDPCAATVKIIGVGGAGANVLARLIADPEVAASLALVHTNASVLESSRCGEKLLLGKKLLRGLGAACDPDLGRAAVQAELEPLRRLCAGFPLILLVGGMGGGTATGALPFIARVAREAGALVLGVVAMPFEFEGQRCERQAQAGLSELRAAADAVLTLRNENVCHLLGESTRATEIFDTANAQWAESLRGLLQMLSRRGLIQVDLADLTAVLRGRNTESRFASIEVSGEGRRMELISRALSHPFLESGQSLREADAVLVNLTGGPDLAMSDVTSVMDELRRQPDNAQFIVGAGIAPEMEGKLRVTIVAVKHGSSDEREKPSPASAAVSETNATGSAEGIEIPSFQLNPVPNLPPIRGVPSEDSPTERKAPALSEPHGRSARARKSSHRLRQGQLPLEIISKGRFEKTPPTIHGGEDLDVPTYIRRGIKLN